MGTVSSQIDPAVVCTVLDIASFDWLGRPGPSPTHATAATTVTQSWLTSRLLRPTPKDTAMVENALVTGPCNKVGFIQSTGG